MRKQLGFSLIELLIVVAVILVIAAIAIPNLMKSRIAANEASAVGSLRSLNTAEVTYFTAYNSYTCALATMGPPSSGSPVTSAAAGIIDSNLASGVKSGYTITVACVGGGTPTVNYQSTAAPVSAGVTGQRYFCSDASGVIKYDASSTANCLSNGVPI